MDFKVLGPMEVSEGDRVIDFGPRMPRAVLAVLLMAANRVVSVDRLVDQLWANDPPATATTALQGYVSILRRALEPERPPRTPPTVLVTEPPGYVLRVPPDAVDAVCFEALVAGGASLLGAGRPDAARDSLRKALALWRGEPYADMAYEPFVQLEAARLCEIRAQAVELLADAHLQHGDHVRAAAELEGLVASDPLRERRWEMLALALYRCGRQADALRALATARTTLVEELGLEPGPSLRRMEDDILSHSPSLDWQPPVERPVGDLAAVESSRSASAPSPHRPLLGRTEELTELLAALDASMTGHGGVALVAGEPGMGKTRLTEELSERAGGQGVLAVWGRCDEHEAAYWPWVQIVRSAIEEADPQDVRRALQGGAAELAQIVPDVKEFVGGELEPLPMLEPETARARLYDAVVAFVLRLAADRPLVVVVDDLHWADGPSLQLVKLLGARLAQSKLLVVCTYREVEADASDAVRATLASLARVPRLLRVRPRALSEPEVAQLVVAATGAEPADGVAEAIHDRTGGNPFFASELVRLLRTRRHLGAEARDVVRREIPPGVRDVIGMRLRGLPEEAVTMLGVAAVAGSPFDLDVLIDVAGLDEERALELVETALLAGVLVEHPHHIGRYRFSHGLVRDTLYDGLSDVRRARLHRRVGESMAARIGGGGGIEVLDVARQLYAGSALGGAEEAFTWTVRAAEASSARLAFEEAEEELRRALELLERMPPGPEAAARERVVQVHLGSLMFMTRGCTEPAVERAWSRALQLSREAGDVPELLPTLWGLWAYHCVRAEFSEALELADELLREGQRTGHPVYLMVGHETVGVTCWHQGRLTDARGHLENAVAIADGLPDEVFTGILLQEHPGVACRCFAAVVLWLLGEPQRAQEVLDEANSLVRRIAHPYGIAFALFFDAWFAVLADDPVAVVARADETISLAHEHGFRQWLGGATILRGWGLTRQGDVETGLAQFDEGMEELAATGTHMLRHFFLGLKAEAQRNAGRSPDALATVEEAVAESEAVGERFWEAELHRMRGELLATGGPVEAAQAAGCFQRALDVARAQSASALERRAAASVAARYAGGGGRA